MRLTPNGRRPPGAEDIDFNYKDSDADAKARARHLSNVELTIKTHTSIPEIREKQSKAKEQKVFEEKRYQELKSILSEMKSSLIDEIMEYSKTNSIDEVLKYFSEKIKRYKILHDEYDILAKHFNVHYSSDYSDLFLDLSRNNSEFLVYSPASTFTKANPPLPINQLTNEQLQILQLRLKESDIFSNKTFLNKYLRYFPDYISKMTNINDIFYALSRKPEMYQIFKTLPSFVAMSNNIKNYKLLLSTAPKTLLYMSDEEIKFVADDSPSKIGAVLNRYPETIIRLNNKFFDKYPPKLVFGTCSTPKTQLFVKFKKYLSDYPTLNTYLTTYAYNNVTKIDDGGMTV